MTRTTMLLDDDLLLEVKRLARAQESTVTEIVREALRAYVAQRRRSRLPAFAKVGRSGRRSISQNAENILRQKARRRQGW